MMTSEVIDASTRWEHGSDFHWMSYCYQGRASSPWNSARRLFGCGRDALRALIRYGLTERNWRRLWVPSYFCQDVLDSILSEDIQVVIYPDNPLDKPSWDSIITQDGDVVLTVNYFGLRDRGLTKGLDGQGVEVVEDHTHDPWSDWAWRSDADWCIASLRKTLPVPDGAVLWSPSGHSLPPVVPATNLRQMASLRKLAAMMLKQLYLAGQPIHKDTFRQLAVTGNQEIPLGEASGITNWTLSLLDTFPVEDWRRSRRTNHMAFSKALGDSESVRVVKPESPALTPFSGVILFDSPQIRDYVLKRLLEHKVYPAILWILDNSRFTIPYENLSFSMRMLSIHCDMRYNESDMIYVAHLLRRFSEEFNSEISSR